MKTEVKQYIERSIAKGLIVGKFRTSRFGTPVMQVVSLNRVEEDKYSVIYECYQDESIDDDDLSFTGFYLPAKMGLARRRFTWDATSADIPQHVIALLDTCSRK